MQTEQLTLDVGLKLEPPLASTFRIGGELSSLHHELNVDETVQILVMGVDGEIMLSKYARVGSVAFIKHRDSSGPEWVERSHKLKLVDAAEAS